MKNSHHFQCLLLIFPCILGGISSNIDTTQLLWRTLNALEGGLHFLDEEYTRLNLDAIIGTRLVEGQLGILLKHLTSPSAHVTPPGVLQKLKQLQVLADRVSNLSTPRVKINQPHYYQRIGALLEKGFWTLDYASRNVDKSLILTTHDSVEAMQEDDSDDCLTELFGTSGETIKTCQITQRCWDLMTKPGYSGYSLSHEVFYLEIGESFGCFKDKFLDVVDELNNGFCANMYAEAMDIFKRGYPENRQDLFMEIPALCGMLGYKQFFRDDWLEAMLSWQWSRGCWGSLRPPLPKGVQGRFKREEKQLPDGCECHRTAVAIGALTQYTRFIIEYMQQQGTDSIMR